MPGVLDLSDVLLAICLPTSSLLGSKSARTAPSGSNSSASKPARTSAPRWPCSWPRGGTCRSTGSRSLSDARPELLFNQLIGGSNSVRSLHPPLRATAALARTCPLAAAAQQRGTRPEELPARNGAVLAPDGRSATFDALSAAADTSLVPSAPEPKPGSGHARVGIPASRIDAGGMVTGRAR